MGSEVVTERMKGGGTSMENTRFKFRAWDKFEVMMSYDVTLYANGWFEVVFPDGYESKYTPTSGLKVMQYTGLTDKNGTEIYEGDVCETVTVSGKPFGTIDFVSFLDGGFIFKDIEDKLLPISLNDSEIVSIEVIGNIYENPELLETNT